MKLFSQIIFSFIFIFNLLFFYWGFDDFVLIYLFSLWIWLTYLSRKVISNKEHKINNIIVRLNYIIPLLVIIADSIVMFLSSSFGVRLLFAVFHIYEIMIYTNLIIYPISIILNLYLLFKYFLSKDKDQNKFILIANLLIYPLGIWSLPKPLNS